jgi:hypothetical protein
VLFDRIDDIRHKFPQVNKGIDMHAFI